MISLGSLFLYLPFFHLIHYHLQKDNRQKQEHNFRTNSFCRYYIQFKLLAFIFFFLQCKKFAYWIVSWFPSGSLNLIILLFLYFCSVHLFPGKGTLNPPPPKKQTPVGFYFHFNLFLFLLHEFRSKIKSVLLKHYWIVHALNNQLVYNFNATSIELWCHRVELGLLLFVSSNGTKGNSLICFHFIVFF